MNSSFNMQNNYSAKDCLSDIINKRGYLNLNLNDVLKTLERGNIGIVCSGTGSGENRMHDAMKEAMDCISKEYRIESLLMNFYCSREHAIAAKDVEVIDEFVKCENVLWGINYEEELDESVRVTIIVSATKA